MNVEPKEAGTADEVPSPSSAQKARARAAEADDDDTTTAARSATQELAAFVDEHPIAALATAVGAGYVVGGGLFTPLTGRVVGLAWRLGIRFALLPILESQVATLLSPGSEASSEDEDEG
jgi:hypothetical protein